MKIKITQDIPVNAKVKPVIGGIYDVIRTEVQNGRNIYFINSEGEKIGVYSRECEVL